MDFNQAIRTLERASSIPQAATLSARLAPRSMAAYGAGWKRVRKTITENSQLSSYTSNPEKEREILTSALAHIAAVSTSTTGYEHANTAIKHFLNARSPDFSSIHPRIARQNCSFVQLVQPERSPGSPGHPSPPGLIQKIE